MKRIKIIVYFAIFCMVSLNFVIAQEIQVNIKADTTFAKIGEQINLKISAKTEKSLKLIWPQIPDSIGKLEFISKSPLDTIQDSIYKIYIQNIKITSFDSGKYEIPAFTFIYEKPGFNSPYPISSNSLILQFATVAVDTTMEIKDIKGPLEAGWSWEEFYIYFIILILLIISIIATYFIIKKLKHRKIIYPKKAIPTEAPHIIALRELKRVAAQKIWQNGRVKEYHSEISDIIRTYIEYRFNFNAMEMTTSEILSKLKEIEIAQDSETKLIQLLELSDLAKFAKYEPLPNENHLSITNAFDFVNQTANLSEDNSNNSGNVKKEDF